MSLITVSKDMRLKLTKLKEEIYRSTIIIRNLNTPLSTIHGTIRFFKSLNT
jgi:hypothetical protein